MTVMGEAQWGAYMGYQWGTMWNYFRVHLPLGGGVYTYTVSVESPENAFCNTQVAEAPCTTFNSLVPVLLQSGTGEPRHDIPLYSLPLRLTVVKIRSVTCPYRRLPRYTICAPPTLTPYHHTCCPLPTSTALCH